MPSWSSWPPAPPPGRAERARGILVVELSAGQMVEDVRLAVEGRSPVAFHGRTGGMVPTPDEVIAALRRLWAITLPRNPELPPGERPPRRAARSVPPQPFAPPPPAPLAPPARVIAGRPALLEEKSTHYCPGCGHGVIHRLLAELLGDLGVAERTIAGAPVGCSVFIYDYIDVDWVEAPHGRAPAVATGIRRVRPEAFVLMYQGDGDLAAIGTGEIIHAAARGERITAGFVNNGIYGMTGGPVAPATLLGPKTPPP